MGKRVKRVDPREEQTEPDWRGFWRIMAIGRLRHLGLTPMPPELLKQKSEDSKIGTAG
jgi:hypothetical protein